MASIDCTPGGTAFGRLGFGGIGGGEGGGKKGGSKKGPPEGGRGLYKYEVPDSKKGKQSALREFLLRSRRFPNGVLGPC
jgi:hypothetical protein